FVFVDKEKVVFGSPLEEDDVVLIESFIRTDSVDAIATEAKEKAQEAIDAVDATTAALASTDPDKGAGMVKLPTGRTVTEKAAEIVSSADYPFTPAPLAEPPSEFAIHGNWG